MFAILRLSGGGGQGLQADLPARAELPGRTEMERVIGQIRGVIASRVVTGTDTIEEVHVLAGLGRPVKQIVRDIETAFAAHFNYDLDYRKISVAQLDSADEYKPQDLRLRLRAIRVEKSEASLAVEVEVEVAGDTYPGRATGSLTEGSGRLAALAVVEALTRALGPECRLALEAFVPTTVGSRRVVLVSVTLAAAGLEDRCLGAALAPSDLAEPAAKAVLLAVNRRLGFVAEHRRKVGG